MKIPQNIPEEANFRKAGDSKLYKDATAQQAYKWQ